jgi:chemotaxis protein methyltransferase CheR
LNPRALIRAEKGEFRPWSLRGCNREFQERWFDARGGLLRIKDSVRSLVRFRELNLVQAHDWPRSIDIIFCRNVTPYFHQAALRQASATLSQALSPEGFVVCASGDPDLLHSGLCRVTHDELRCYRRPALRLHTGASALPRLTPPVKMLRFFAAPSQAPPVLGGERTQAEPRFSGVTPAGIDTQIALDPFNASLYLQRGRLGLEQDRPDAAIRDARRALVADGSAAYSHVLIALAALQTRQLSLALRSARLGKRLVEPVSEAALQTFTDDLSRREIHDLLSFIERFGQSTQLSKPWPWTAKLTQS